MLLTLLLASFLVFAVSEFSPGSVARKTLGPYAPQESVDLLYKTLGLNDPLVERYGRWLGILLGLRADPLQDPALKLNFVDPRGDRYFGNFGYSSLYKAPVNDVIWTRLGATAMLAGIAFAIIVPLVSDAGHPGRHARGRSPSTAPSRCSASWRPPCRNSPPAYSSWPSSSSPSAGCPEPARSGRKAAGRSGRQLVLPVSVLVLYDSGYLVRMVRGSMVDVMNRPFIRTAMLKGLSFRQVVLRHGIRNAMIAPFTVILLQINFLISGVVVTELVFAYPGFGRMILDASLFGDISLIEAATLIALCVAVATQFLGDLGYAMFSIRRSACG